MDQAEAKLTSFTGADANRIFEELKGLNVDLDADPLVYGPKRLNQKVSELKGALGRCERIFLDISQQHHAVQRLKGLAELDLELAKKKLFADDPETRSGRSVSDREAIATGKLTEDVRALRELDMTLLSLDAVISVIKTTRSSLRDTQARLRDQIRLCQEEIGLGSSWGSKVPNAKPLKPPTTSRASLDAIDDLVGRVDGEIQIVALDEDEGIPLGEVDIPATETNVGVIDDVDIDALASAPYSKPVSPHDIVHSGSVVGAAPGGVIPQPPIAATMAPPVVRAPIVLEDDLADPLGGILETSTPAPLELGGGEDAKVLPSDGAPAVEADAFMDALAEDPYASRISGTTTALDDSLDSILESFEEVKK